MMLTWSEESLHRLIDIEEFISIDNPGRAIEFIDEIINKAEEIPMHPKIGRIVPEISNPTIRELIFTNYRIVYRIQDYEVQILTIFEAHQLIRRKEILKH